MGLKKIDLGNNSYFIGESLKVGKNFSVGFNNTIRATKCLIGNNVTIKNNNNFLIGDTFEIADNGFIGSGNDFTGLKISFGDYLYLDSNVIIGHGGKLNYNSILDVGNHVMICAYTKININYKVIIGNDVGIGEYVDIWTHGSYPPVLDGFPYQFGPVTIGNNSWVPAKSTVLPNVTIGNNVVIGANSVINKNLPDRSLCAGIPAKVIKENAYPKKLTLEQKISIINETLDEYQKLLQFKSVNLQLEFNPSQLVIQTKNTTFDFKKMTIEGELDDLEEDLRDFLRRRGMKFFTGKPFKSILPPMYKKLLDYEEGN